MGEIDFEFSQIVGGFGFDVETPLFIISNILFKGISKETVKVMFAGLFKYKAYCVGVFMSNIEDNRLVNKWVESKPPRNKDSLFYYYNLNNTNMHQTLQDIINSFSEQYIK